MLIEAAGPGAETWAPLAAQRDFELAILTMNDGELQKSEELYYASVNAAERGHDDDTAAHALTVLGYMVGSTMGRADEGLRILRLARAVSERSSRPQDYAAVQLQNEANIFLLVGRYHDALAPLEQAIASEVRWHLDEASHAKTLTSYGNALALNGREAEAERIHEQALAIHEKSFGVDHPVTCITAEDVGVDLVMMGRSSDALPLFNRVLAARERQLRPGHPAQATVLTNRAAAFNALGRYPDGLADATRAIAIFDATFGPDYAAVTEPLDYAAAAASRWAIPIAHSRSLSGRWLYAASTPGTPSTTPRAIFSSPARSSTAAGIGAARWRSFSRAGSVSTKWPASWAGTTATRSRNGIAGTMPTRSERLLLRVG